MVKSTDRPAMTIAVDLGRKATKQTNKLFTPHTNLEFVSTQYLCYHSASLVMPNNDPLDRFFYPTLTLMMDLYIIESYDHNCMFSEKQCLESI